MTCSGSRFFVSGRVPGTALALAALAVLAAAPRAASAHPAPFSYLDIHVGGRAVAGRLVVHTIDAAQVLRLPAPDALGDPVFLRRHLDALAAILEPRLRLTADGRPLRWRITGGSPLAEQDSIELSWVGERGGPVGHLAIEASLFPYDPNHQTFVNVYEGDELSWQEVLNRSRMHAAFYSGTRQGRVAVLKNFTASGVHHIAIGPDHILFIIGLLLLGGSLRRLLAIVTAFTAGHSVTLALATLNIVDPPAHLVEPVIALSIVYVGADNLLAGSRGRDVRVWIALFFGLVHGFGFASVLRETGLPPRALGLSLFAFNAGVEIGQAAIVVVVATALTLLRRRHAILAARLVTAGSVLVLLAGAFWFLERVL